MENFHAARARSRCCAMAASKPAMSIITPRSRQMSAVRSTGKPKVSYSRNTVSPSSSFSPEASADSSTPMPFSSVSAKRSSSCLRTSATRSRAAQLRIGVAHRAVEVGHQAMEERLLLAELVAVANRAADDPAQHVAAALVAGDYAIDDQEAARADVVRDDIERRTFGLPRPRFARRRLDQVLEQIDLIVRMLALQHRGDALE